MEGGKWIKFLITLKSEKVLRMSYLEEQIQTKEWEHLVLWERYWRRCWCSWKQWEFSHCSWPDFYAHSKLYTLQYVAIRVRISAVYRFACLPLFFFICNVLNNNNNRVNKQPWRKFIPETRTLERFMWKDSYHFWLFYLNKILTNRSVFPENIKMLPSEKQCILAQPLNRPANASCCIQKAKY